MGEWKEYKFSDFVNINPSVKLLKGERYSFVEMKDLADGQRHCFPTVGRALSGGARFNEGDTLFARITPCLENGKICQVKGLKNSVGFGSTEFFIFRGKDGVSNNDFVYYLSRWDEVRAFAKMNFDGTSGRQRVPKDSFNNLFLNLPDLPEQKSIASILSSLDDKIDLLHRQNKTLEALAETLFRQWFVEEADEGWEMGTIEDEFDFTMGQSPLGSSYNEDGKGMVFFQGRTDFGFRFPEPRVYTTEPNRLAKQFDTLISVRAPVGDINMAMEECCLGRGVAAFRYKHDPTFHAYTYYKMRSLMAQIKQFEDSGTVFGSIGKDDFKKLENIIPPDKVINKFQSEVAPLDEKIYINTLQIKTLTRLRDTLLPKLMSGEVRVTTIGQNKANRANKTECRLTEQIRPIGRIRSMENKNNKPNPSLIPPHGGYRNLKSYQAAEIVYDATVAFCGRFVDKRSRTHDQMVQAARSGKQNIAEGSMASGTSKKTELKLIGIARASLEELLLDYQDFLRQKGLPLWEKNHPSSQKIRKLAWVENRSYMTYKTYLEKEPPEVAANAAICLIHQANYLLDQQLRQLEKQFIEEGGFTERLYQARTQARKTK